MKTLISRLIGFTQVISFNIIHKLKADSFLNDFRNKRKIRPYPKFFEVCRVQRILLFLSNGRISVVLRHWGIKPVARERFTISVITGVNTDSRTGLQYSAGTGSRSQLFTWKVIRSDIFFDDTDRKFVNSCGLSSQQISKVAGGFSEIICARMESILSAKKFLKL